MNVSGRVLVTTYCLPLKSSSVMNLYLCEKPRNQVEIPTISVLVICSKTTLEYGFRKLVEKC